MQVVDTTWATKAKQKRLASPRSTSSSSLTGTSRSQAGSPARRRTAGTSLSANSPGTPSPGAEARCARAPPHASTSPSPGSSALVSSRSATTAVGLFSPDTTRALQDESFVATSSVLSPCARSAALAQCASRRAVKGRSFMPPERACVAGGSASSPLDSTHASQRRSASEGSGALAGPPGRPSCAAFDATRQCRCTKRTHVVDLGSPQAFTPCAHLPVTYSCFTDEEAAIEGGGPSAGVSSVLGTARSTPRASTRSTPLELAESGAQHLRLCLSISGLPRCAISAAAVADCVAGNALPATVCSAHIVSLLAAPCVCVARLQQTLLCELCPAAWLNMSVMMRRHPVPDTTEAR
jgi:hypothetical protein